MDVEYLGSSGSPLGSVATSAHRQRAHERLRPNGRQHLGMDSAATARQNSHAYAVGDVIKLPTNPGRVFFCTDGRHVAGSEPGGYATAVDGGSVTDGGATSSGPAAGSR